MPHRTRDEPLPGDRVFEDEWALPLLWDRMELEDADLERWRSREERFVIPLLIEASGMDFDRVGEIIGRVYHLECLAPDAVPDPTEEALAAVPRDTCLRHFIVPLTVDRKTIRVATANPMDINAIHEVEWLTDRTMVPVYTLPAGIERILNRIEDHEGQIFDLLRSLNPPEEVEILSSRKKGGDQEGELPEVQAPVIRLVNAILADAVERGASDIHLEHEPDASLVRFRIDGELESILSLPRSLGGGPVVARIKIMADLNVADHLRPQDGRTNLRIDDREVGLRVSTLPTRDGEKVVIRILDEERGLFDLDELGFPPETRERFVQMLENNEGILLVTGPTGSGKTTTLYAAIRRLQDHSVNIITIEDPAEFHLDGITQVQVNEAQGLTFAATFRSVLRQDPDIILVGEIRDAETADIAFQAALTGHLVLATVHTNDAIGSVVRLVDIGVEPFRVAGGLVGVTSQRLVRRLCSECRFRADPGTLPRRIREEMEALDIPPVHWKAEGCQACGGEGYDGRISLVEILSMNPTLRDAIGEDPSESELHEIARSHGLLHPLAEDALERVAQGETTIEEVRGHLDLHRVFPGSASTAEESVPDTNAAYAPVGTLPASLDRRAGRRPIRVLVASDERPLLESLGHALAQAGIALEIVDSRSALLARAENAAPDVVIVGPGVVGDREGTVMARDLRSTPALEGVPVLVLGKDQAVETEGSRDGEPVLRFPMKVRSVVRQIQEAHSRDPGAFIPEEPKGHDEVRRTDRREADPS